MKVSSLQKMITKDELSENLPITKNTLAEKASMDHLNTSRMKDALTRNFPYANVFEKQVDLGLRDPTRFFATP